MVVFSCAGIRDPGTRDSGIGFSKPRPSLRRRPQLPAASGREPSRPSVTIRTNHFHGMPDADKKTTNDDVLNGVSTTLDLLVAK